MTDTVPHYTKEIVTKEISRLRERRVQPVLLSEESVEWRLGRPEETTERAIDDQERGQPPGEMPSPTREGSLQGGNVLPLGILILEAYDYLRAAVKKVADDAGPDWVARLTQWVEFLGQRVKSIVLEAYRDRVDVVDAKYKAHLAELDEHGWRAFAEDARSAHRADIHQVLAYASLFDAAEVRAVLVYPLRERTWRVLRDRGRETSVAELLTGRRRVRVELRGLPFGLTA